MSRTCTLDRAAVLDDPFAQRLDRSADQPSAKDHLSGIRPADPQVSRSPSSAVNAVMLLAGMREIDLAFEGLKLPRGAAG